MTLPIAQVAAYLTSTGWRVTSESWRGARVWTHESADVLLPERDDLGDNPARLREVLRTVADVENRAADAVADDIARPDLDAAELRGPRDSNGTVALLTGLEAIAGLRDLVAVAARTVVEGPHLHFRGGAPPVVDGFLRRLRLALAERAGLSCSVLVPVDALDDLVGRDVLVQLHDAVVAIADAVGADDPQAFDRTVTAGVSANLCSAASALAGVSRTEPFELTFRWAHGLPGALPTRTVVFPNGSGRIVRAASRRLRRLEVSGTAAVVGRVDGMHDEAGSVDRWRMRVRGDLTASDGASTRGVIWLRLPDQATYDQLVEAYRAGGAVRVGGVLARRDDRVELITAAEGIEIVDEPEDDRAR